MAKVRVVLNRNCKRYPAGFAFTCYGHPFVVQKDGTATALVDEAFAKIEVPAGHYRYLEDIPRTIPTMDTSYVDSFGYDIDQYYGAGDLETLKAKIEDMRKAEIMIFADTRLSEKLPTNMSKSRMVFEVLQRIREELGLTDDKPAPVTDVPASEAKQKKMAFEMADDLPKTLDEQLKAETDALYHRTSKPKATTKSEKK